MRFLALACAFGLLVIAAPFGAAAPCTTALGPYGGELRWGDDRYGCFRGHSEWSPDGQNVVMQGSFCYAVQPGNPEGGYRCFGGFLARGSDYPSSSDAPYGCMYAYEGVDMRDEYWNGTDWRQWRQECTNDRTADPISVILFALP